MTDFVKPLVASILRDEHREWTAQGFGFLRTYFGPPDAPKKYRLNLWDHRFTVPNVSTIHDHPWDFTSLIVAGKFYNQRYEMLHASRDRTHHYTTIKCGLGGGMEKSDFDACALTRLPIEQYLPGEWYHQQSSEIHETLFRDGSVTVNERIGDTEHARVFWPYGTDWVDAMPRLATREEVSAAVAQSLREWF